MSGVTRISPVFAALESLQEVEPAGERRTRIALTLIDVGARLREIDPAWAEAIAVSMAASGQSQAVVVRPTAGGRFELVIGGHRIAAAKINGWTEIDADIRELSDAEARLAEIDENLMRRELGALDRAIFLAERKTVWDELYDAPRHGGDRKSSDFARENQTDKMSVWSFTKEAAEKTGLTDRTIRRSIALVSSISPDVIARIRGTYLADHASDLARLADMEPAEQEIAAEALGDGSVKRLGDLRPRDRLPAEEAQLKALHAAWSRASSKARRRFMRDVGHAPSPKAHLALVDGEAAE